METKQAADEEQESYVLTTSKSNVVIIVALVACVLFCALVVATLFETTELQIRDIQAGKVYTVSRTADKINILLSCPKHNTNRATSEIPGEEDILYELMCSKRNHSYTFKIYDDANGYAVFDNDGNMIGWYKTYYGDAEAVISRIQRALKDAELDYAQRIQGTHHYMVR